MGLPPTDDELDQLTGDLTQLPTLIDQWFIRPEAQLKMRGFYANMFQQSQVIESDMGAQFGYPTQGDFLRARVMQTVRESFPRTVQALVADGKPFTETITTKTVMMNPALMSLYIMADDVMLSDKNQRSRRHPTDDGQLHMWLEYVPPESGSPITLAESLNAKSDRYLHFNMDAPYTCQIPVVDAKGYVVYGADGKPTYTSKSFNKLGYNVDGVVEQGAEMKLLQRLMTGSVQGATGGQKGILPADLAPPADVPAAKLGDYKVKCPFRWDAKAPLLTEDDFKWRPVTIEERDEKDQTGHIAYWDLPALRGTDRLRLNTPRVGFFSTPAFLGTFPTNQSNQARVTINQALVVAIGRSISPVDKGGAPPVLDTGKDGSHSDPSSPCFSCHQTIDPMRNVLLRNWTYSYSQQKDADHQFLDATFDFGGVIDAKMTTLDDLAKVLSTHPLYATAVTQKLCYYINSAPCSTSDPEFVRVAQVFTDSQFNFRKLVRELLSSPLVTGLSETQTLTDRGEVVSIARFNHLCTSVTNRLGLFDKLGAGNTLCSGVAPTGASNELKNRAKAVAAQLSTNIPSDGFARGAEGPLLPTASTMFFRSASETLCQLGADFSVDVTDGAYQSDKKDQAITAFVATIMGLGAGDPAREGAAAILTAHYDKALAAGAKPTEALKSTFTLACTSPTSVALGL
ncbi:MAG: DUF1800 family protein [Myxococcales bacterium]|nr:MAG: DUF1800 family protein [Myxococcales bacterium]